MNAKPIALAMLGMLAGPASATLMLSADINGTTITCTDNQASTALCPGGDTNPAVGTLQTQDQTIAGVQFLGSSQQSVKGPPQNSLNSSSFQFVNNNTSTVHLQLAVGDTSYASPTATFSSSGSGTFQSAIGSVLDAMVYRGDTGNTQPATTPTTLPGVNLGGPDSVAAVTLATQSFSFNHGGTFITSAPYSMDLGTTIDLVAGGSVVGRNQAIVTDVVPATEPATLALLGTALLGLGMVRWARR